MDISGLDTLLYRVCNTINSCDTAIVYLVIENYPPLAIVDYDTTDFFTPVTYPVLDNDSDLNGDEFTITEIQNPSANGVAIIVDDSIRYTPTYGFIGSDTLDYIICDNCTPPLCDTTQLIIEVTNEGLYDYGDLPDIANGETGTNDYETLQANGGPRHLILPGLFLGDTLDIDTDGQPHLQAKGDDENGLNDEDGVVIFPTLDVCPTNELKIPLSYTNRTGTTAYVKAWIDWDGNGNFNTTELVYSSSTNSPNVQANMIFSVPPNIAIGQIVGLRVRLSQEDSMTAYGEVVGGEVEDYVLPLGTSRSICLPVVTRIRRN